jgi:DNA modification methylase
MPLRDKEDVLVFYASPCTYNPQFSEGAPYRNKAGNPSKATSQTASYGAYTNFRYDNEGKRYPRQVIDFGVVERGTQHPTQKPVALMEYLIKTYTNEGETVLDFTMGSGTTGVACMNLGRKFIGIEKDDKYFEIASKRILEVAEKKTITNFME